MKIISSNKDFESTLIDLIEKYEQIHISVAWASAGTKVFDALLDKKDKLSLTTIGIAYNHTDPDVLEAFVDSKHVKIRGKSRGVFHPKVYFFSNKDGNEWEAIIGSANLTNGALTVNQELCVSISNHDTEDDKVKDDLKECIENYFNGATTITSAIVEEYRTKHEKEEDKRKSLSKGIELIPDVIPAKEKKHPPEESTFDGSTAMELSTPESIAFLAELEKTGIDTREKRAVINTYKKLVTLVTLIIKHDNGTPPRHCKFYHKTMKNKKNELQLLEVCSGPHSLDRNQVTLSLI